MHRGSRERRGINREGRGIRQVDNLVDDNGGGGGWLIYHLTLN